MLLFSFKNMRCSGMARDPSHHKVGTCFFKELTIILNGFLNIRFSCVRRECNTDRCPSRKCAKYVFFVNGLIPVLTKNIISALMFSFPAVFDTLNEQRIQWVQLGRLKKVSKCNDTYLHLNRISCAPLIRLPDRYLQFECNILHLNVIF